MRASDERQYTDYVTARLPELRRLAYQLTGDTHRADDVVQTAITRLYVHWRKATAASNIDAYVRTIVVRTFLNEQRGWLSRIRLFGSATEIPLPVAAPGRDVLQRTVVETALTRLPPRQRAVLVLRFLHDLAVADVARLLGCSEGNVKALTSHGLSTLRRQLKGKEELA